ncbi:MAG: glycoside hydrolase family 73 protein [Lacticaseibacillus songhuajiangensis]|nr:glycoside hydrolase family 73 protein [Lacticaseibacillus songhuajiangensis]
MAYKRRKKRNPVPIGLLALIVALVVGFMTVMVQYEHVQNVQEEAARSSSSAAMAKKQAFVHRLAPYAQTLYANYGVLPSITLAQAILESNWGNSTLASQYHNLFGVKADANQSGRNLTTSEYVNGQWQTVTARFRVYSDDYASMREHAILLYQGTSWNRGQYAAVVKAADYETAAKALQSSGYATDPDYASKLIAIIKKYQLSDYDTKK